jgi:hypothetical protein
VVEHLPIKHKALEFSPQERVERKEGRREGRRKRGREEGRKEKEKEIGVMKVPF